VVKKEETGTAFHDLFLIRGGENVKGPDGKVWGKTSRSGRNLATTGREEGGKVYWTVGEKSEH